MTWMGEVTGCKPCPWCKRVPVARQQKWDNKSVWNIGCPSAFTVEETELAACKMRPCAVNFGSLPEAKATWNSQ